MSSSVSSTHSARREIGTQASVANGRAPGLSVICAQKPSWRACQSLVRSSGLVAQMKSPPPLSATISPKRLRLLGDALLRAVKLDQQHRMSRAASDCEYVLNARTDSVSRSSIRAIGRPDWIVWIVVVAG